MGKLNIGKYALQSLVVGGVLFVCGSVAAQDYSSRIRNLPTDRAYQELLHAKIFNLGGVGYALQITPEENAFRTIFESLNSIKEFKRLLEQATPEGQLYALFGLHLKVPDIFRAEAARLRADDGPAKREEKFTFIRKGQVRIADGCLIFTQDRRKVIDQIAKGEFDTRFKSSPRIVTH